MPKHSGTIIARRPDRFCLPVSAIDRDMCAALPGRQPVESRQRIARQVFQDRRGDEQRGLKRLRCRQIEIGGFGQHRSQRHLRRAMVRPVAGKGHAAAGVDQCAATRAGQIRALHQRRLHTPRGNSTQQARQFRQMRFIPHDPFEDQARMRGQIAQHPRQITRWHTAPVQPHIQLHRNPQALPGLPRQLCQLRGTGPRVHQPDHPACGLRLHRQHIRHRRHRQRFTHQMRHLWPLPQKQPQHGGGKGHHTICPQPLHRKVQHRKTGQRFGHHPH